MPLQTVTLSSAGVPGTSAPAQLNWRGGKPATVSIFVSTVGGSSGTVDLQYTLDDLMLVGGSSLAVWQGVAVPLDNQRRPIIPAPSGLTVCCSSFFTR